jgi:hypothetical protein
MSKKRMLPLMFGENKNHLSNMTYEEKSKLWHLRYGHLNFHSLKLLTSNELVYGLSKVQENEDVFEGCAKGKHEIDKFSKGNAGRAHYPLHLVHSNICGPMHTKSLGKSSYFITFIDDYSRKCQFYFLNTKDESFDTFKRFKTLVENKRGCKIKCLGIDCGG